MIDRIIYRQHLFLRNLIAKEKIIYRQILQIHRPKMVQSIIGVIMATIFAFLICKKQYLNSSELYLLVTGFLLTLATIFYGWFTYLTYLILLGMHFVTLFNMSKHTYYFDRNKSTHQFSQATQYFFRIEEEEINVIVYAIALWIWIRVNSMKSVGFVINGGTFLDKLNGWNCNLAQFWWINSLWLIFGLLACYSCLFLLRYESDHNNLYKLFLLKYKLIYDCLILAIVVGYNYNAYSTCNSLQQCQQYHESGLILRLLWFFGIPLTTIIFFFKKHGFFSLDSHSECSQQPNDLEQKLNEAQIDKQLIRISSISKKDNILKK